MQDLLLSRKRDETANNAESSVVADFTNLLVGGAEVHCRRSWTSTKAVPNDQEHKFVAQRSIQDVTQMVTVSCDAGNSCSDCRFSKKGLGVTGRAHEAQRGATEARSGRWGLCEIELGGGVCALRQERAGGLDDHSEMQHRLQCMTPLCRKRVTEVASQLAAEAARAAASWQNRRHIVQIWTRLATGGHCAQVELKVAIEERQSTQLQVEKLKADMEKNEKIMSEAREPLRAVEGASALRGVAPTREGNCLRGSGELGRLSNTHTSASEPIESLILNHHQNNGEESFRWQIQCDSVEAHPLDTDAKLSLRVGNAVARISALEQKVREREWTPGGSRSC